jgi:hypothetical protein
LNDFTKVGVVKEMDRRGRHGETSLMPSPDRLFSVTVPRLDLPQVSAMRFISEANIFRSEGFGVRYHHDRRDASTVNILSVRHSDVFIIRLYE